jgi:hypothetical protein
MEEVVKKEKVEGNRKIAVESHLIRIMKTNKTMLASELIVGVQASLHMFKPQAKFIKECIEGLIEREYLIRDENDNSKLHYLA